MSVGISVVQGRGAFLDLQIRAGLMDDAVKAAVRRLSAEYRREVAALLSRPGTGKQYRRTRGGYKVVRRRVEVFGGRKATVRERKRLDASGETYRASVPGQPPARFTGNLLRGLTAKFPSKGKGYTGVVFTNRRQAAHRHLLEFGTKVRFQPTKGGKRRNVGRVAPRPVWSPLAARAQAEMEAAVLAALGEMTR